MATSKKNPAFAELDDTADVVEVIEETPVVSAPKSAPAQDNLVTARVKGTWKMFWGREIYDFEDGKRYRIPRDLYDYLVRHSNIYDTV